MSAVSIRLESVVDWAGFSRAVRALRVEGIAPDDVGWRMAAETEGAIADLFDPGTERRPADMADGPAMPLPRAFVEAAREVFLHADPRRLPLLHRLALRVAEDARAWADPLHEDRLQFERHLREVRREIHKMHAFVRFRRLVSTQGAPFDDAVARAPGAGLGAPHCEEPDDAPAIVAASQPVPSATALDAADSHVAWFEPAHHVLEAAAPFFARRFATMRWAILTPRASVQWDGRALSFGPGARREDAPAADAGEALWLAYYRSIFNPARVKVAMMKKEMPVRFWKNLPEAAAIPSLLVEAPRRQRRMVDDGGVERSRRRGKLLERAAPASGDTGELGGGRTSASVDGADAVELIGDGRPRETRIAAVVPLHALARQALRCRDCPGADAATQTVFGDGPADARVMIVGEQPGDQEDLRGLPFQGPAGQLLRGAMRELAWPAEAVYLTNAVKHFHHELRGKRRIHKTPGQQEAMACLHWLESEIETLRPRAIVALGATAVRSLLGADVSVTANEGRWLARADGTPVLVCLHPAAILRADPSRHAGMRARWVESLRQASAHVLGEATPSADAGGETPPERIAA